MISTVVWIYPYLFLNPLYARRVGSSAYLHGVYHSHVTHVLIFVERSMLHWMKYKSSHLTHCGLVTPYSDRDLGQPWLGLLACCTKPVPQPILIYHPWLCDWDACYIIFCHLFIIFFRGCAPEMFVTSYFVTYCIYVPGKPGICFHYYCAVSDECKYSDTFCLADRTRLLVQYTISLS